jgi:beta-fructofuranosidase
LELVIDPGEAEQVGVRIACSEDGRESTSLFYHAVENLLVCDATESSLETGRMVVERAPFELTGEEQLHIRVFVDRSIVEVYANERQAIARRIYPTLGGTGVRLFCRGGDAKVISAKAWELMPSNPY